MSVKHMESYIFYDTDFSGKEEYDISGDQYIQLLKTCFKYSHSVGMCLAPGFDEDLSAIKQYRIHVTPLVKKSYRHYNALSLDENDEKTNYRLVHYLLTPEVKMFLLNRTNSIFKWTYAWGNNNPDDLCFFRSDGSVFFSSLIHEGECTLSPIDGEDILPIVEDARWVKIS